MGTVDLDYLKQGFASLVQQAEHTTLPTFILWLDLKVAEFKVNGFMMLDDSRISGEGWLEFIQRWRSHSLGAYTGYQYVHPSFAANQGVHANPSSGGHVTAAENILHGSRPRGPEHGDLGVADPLRQHQHRVAEQVSGVGDHGRGQSDNVVQIKPEPDLDRLQQEMRHERPQPHPSHIYSDSAAQAMTSQHQRRTSFDYPVIADSIPPMDMARRTDRIPLPMEYTGAHIERSMLRHNSDGHDPVPPDFLGDASTRKKEVLLSDGGPLGLGVDARDSERDSLQTTVSGFFKTTNSSGVPLVSRQTANRCPVCNRIFHYYSSFNRHMKLHQGVFTHICEVCRRKFTRKEHFVRHKCHRRPNKPSRMADLSEADTSVGGAGDPLVQPPPTSNEVSPREVSIPPPLIHISEMAETLTSSADRNAFTYDTQQPLYPESSPALTMEPTPMELSFGSCVGSSSERPPYLVETSTNNKHRRKTTTPMKVEAFMEPPPSVDTPAETPTRCSPVDPPEVFEKHPLEYSRDVPMTYNYRRASSSDLGKSSTSAGEFNISRPQSRNSEPARGSHYDRVSLDQPLEGMSGSYQEMQEDKHRSYSGELTPTPTSVVLRDDQYPVLKRKVLEAACSLSQLDSSNNNYPETGAVQDGVRGGSSASVYPGHEGSEHEQLTGDGDGGCPSYGEESTDILPTDYSATGTPTGHSSPISGGGDTASTNPNAAPTTPTSDATPSSAAAMSPYGSQSGEGPLGDYEQHISPGGSIRDNTLSLNMSLSAPSAYASCEPSSPAAKQQGDIHCQSCNRRFLHLSSLNRHMKLHKGVFSHACAVCSRKFTRKEHFVNHKCSRRPRNPTRVMESEPDAFACLPQKVEFPPSMTLPKQPSPPEAATWNAGAMSLSTAGIMAPGLLPVPPGTPMTPGEGGSPPTLTPESPTNDQRGIFKWKSKWK